MKETLKTIKALVKTQKNQTLKLGNVTFKVVNRMSLGKRLDPILDALVFDIPLKDWNVEQVKNDCLSY